MIESKIKTRQELKVILEDLKREGKAVVFTNGCFDILHVGHVDYLAFARSQGSALVVGLNSDASVKRDKSLKRPINNEVERALLLAALAAVDYVVIFDEDEPTTIVETLLPDVLIKGEDWAHYISGRKAVERNGGHVVLARKVQGQSTTNTIARILAAEKKEKT